MGLREDLLKKIEKKNQEVRELESQIREANAYIQGLHDVVKIIPKENGDDYPPERKLRPNSDMAKAQDFLRKVGKPLYVGEILEGIGKGDTKRHRLSLSGSLGDYVRKGEIFNRPAPNTFGLIEFTSSQEAEESEAGSKEAAMASSLEPPENFGLSASQNTEDDPFADE